MERHKTFALALAALLPFGGAAASAAQRHTHPGASATSTEIGEQTPATEAAETGAAEKGELRDQASDRTGLFAIEDRAEAIAEGEKKGAAALAAAHEVVTRWPGVRATLAQNGATDPGLSSADSAIRALGADLRSLHGDLRRDANEVTGALAPLFSLTGDKVPADVHRLDYLGRSIDLDAQANAWSRATADAQALSATWQRLRPAVLARHGGAAVAAEYDAVATHAGTAAGQRKASAAIAAAKMSGNAVDHMEKLWP
jgi:hypothetical protein